jgi:acyl-CoA thioesterase
MVSKFELRKHQAPVSWRRLMLLKKTDDDVFESLTPAWPPAPFKRAFGGHVYAQAVYAASKTVDQGMVVHVCLSPSFLDLSEGAYADTRIDLDLSK